MEYICQSADLRSYLALSESIDHDHPAVIETANRLAARSATDRDYLEQAFLFVRDEVSHSNDLPPEARRVTRTASEAIVAQQGLCYVKAFAFAALLRRRGIPCGLCYQLLRNGDSTLHGLNAVYVPEQSRWIRLDTRGPGRPAFGLAADAFYYIPDPAKGEVDYPFIYAGPDRAVTDALRAHDDFDSLSNALPGALHGFGH